MRFRCGRAGSAISWRALLICGLLVVLFSVSLAVMSRAFAYQSPASDRPIIGFLGLMSLMFVTHLVGLRYATCLASLFDRPVTILIWSVAIASRLVLLPSHPIQEVDLYRYLWDGQVARQGVSPYRFSPASVLAGAENNAKDVELGVLADHIREHSSVKEILRRVHFSELPTPYPPVSQAVFTIVASFVPPHASIRTHVIAMKTAVVVFDLGVVLLLFVILRMTGLKPGWAIAYAWNPLVLKEFAGSGHLDSIAVFFAVLAVACAMRALDRGSSTAWLLAAVSLAIGTAAKLYPVILLPLLLWCCVRSTGIRASVLAALCFLIVAGLTMWPTGWGVQAEERRVHAGEKQETSGSIESFESDDLMPPVPSEALARKSGLVATTDSDDGIAAFLSRWEMNDVLFMVLLENVKPSSDSPWFCVTPLRARQSFVAYVSEGSGVDEQQVPFVVARGVTGILFIVVSVWVIARTDGKDMIAFGHAAFLIIAWFWLLLPTLNPWYWTWALPLICFSGTRAWLLVSGMLPIYYLRFWCIYHAGAWPINSVGGSGEQVFDYFVVFAEHLPWMLAVLIAWWSQKRSAIQQSGYRLARPQ